MAGDIKIGRTAFMDKMGVDSELAYKKQCLKDNRIMFHAHIGMGSWETTAEALAHLHKTAEQSEIIIDRAGICLDRRIGQRVENSRVRVWIFYAMRLALCYYTEATMTLKNRFIAFIGGGQITEIILSNLTRTDKIDPHRLIVSDPVQEKGQHKKKPMVFP